MGVFDSIVKKIFPHGTTSMGGSSEVAQKGPADAPKSETAGAAYTPSEAPVDVESVLTDLASKTRERLNWRESIVDLLKLLDLDSSLSARKELASELHYSGDSGDSAALNIWLHKQVMRKLAENGGKVPEDLKA
jgi:hypothetical protein